MSRQSKLTKIVDNLSKQLHHVLFPHSHPTTYTPPLYTAKETSPHLHKSMRRRTARFFLYTQAIKYKKNSNDSSILNTAAARKHRTSQRIISLLTLIPGIPLNPMNPSTTFTTIGVTLKQNLVASQKAQTTPINL